MDKRNYFMSHIFSQVFENWLKYTSYTHTNTHTHVHSHAETKYRNELRSIEEANGGDIYGKLSN